MKILFPAVATVTVLILLSTLCPQGSYASTIYTYTGNPYSFIADYMDVPGTYTTSMRVTGSFEVSSALGPQLNFADINPLHWSFFDGRNTISDAGFCAACFDSVKFLISTDHSGRISGWEISVTDFVGYPEGQLNQINTFNRPDANGDVFDAGAIWADCVLTSNSSSCFFPAGGGIDLGGTSAAAGVWSSPAVSSPDPSTFTLMLAGLAGLGFLRLRKV